MPTGSNTMQEHLYNAHRQATQCRNTFTNAHRQATQIAKHFVAFGRLDTAHHHSLSQTRTKHDTVQLNFCYPLVVSPANNEQIRVLNVDYVTQAFKHAQLVFVKSLAFPQ